MKRIVCISVLALCLYAFATADAQQTAVTETTIADQTDVAVTIYNNNLGLVRDRRNLRLAPGEFSLKFMDVAQAIIPETVSIRSVTSPGALHIIEQNYEYDLMSPQKLMEKFVGKQVRLVNFSTELGFQEKTAELMSINDGPIYRVGGEIYLGHPGTVVMPEIPENLIAKPTLIWRLDNRAGDQEVEATYLTHGVSWKADYVVRLDKSETLAGIDAWVTLNNQSGAAYTNAQLKLVAGDVNIVRDFGMGGALDQKVRALAAEAAPMVEEAFAEYHLYTLPRRTTIKENQSKQVSLFNASGVSMAKEYEFRGEMHFYSQRLPVIPEQKVAVFLAFKNEEANNLGIPLPAGIMRIYQEDSEGMLQFAGEDRIQHTPKDERVRLRMGNAFDVVGERKQTNFMMLSDRLYESSFEIKIRNHKETPITVAIVEPMPGDWTIVDASHPHEKRDAQTAVFNLPVQPDQEVVLTYRARIRF